MLSGEKQRIERNYNFVDIAQWFAARCDLIFLLFDPYKLDISDEFKQVIGALRGHDDKVRGTFDLIAGPALQTLQTWGTVWLVGNCVVEVRWESMAQGAWLPAPWQLLANGPGRDDGCAAGTFPAAVFPELASPCLASSQLACGCADICTNDIDVSPGRLTP